jgi:hypothetical protein
MLKITIASSGTVVRLKLEGALAGTWVQELETCWRAVRQSLRWLPIDIDLSGCASVDQAGRYLLALLHENGTRLLPGGVAMEEVVDSIRRDWPVGEPRRERARRPRARRP